MEEDQGYFKTVFKWYCVEGAVGMSEIDTMGKAQARAQRIILILSLTHI